jgi:1,2-phenylacetyl-CoA epoxidase PaaB subunit
MDPTGYVREYTCINANIHIIASMKETMNLQESREEYVRRPRGIQIIISKMNKTIKSSLKQSSTDLKDVHL